MENSVRFLERRHLGTRGKSLWVLEVPEGPIALEAPFGHRQIGPEFLYIAARDRLLPAKGMAALAFQLDEVFCSGISEGIDSLLLSGVTEISDA